MFSYQICNIFKNIYFEEYLPKTVSDELQIVAKGIIWWKNNENSKLKNFNKNKENSKKLIQLIGTEMAINKKQNLVYSWKQIN